MQTQKHSVPKRAKELTDELMKLHAEYPHAVPYISQAGLQKFYRQLFEYEPVEIIGEDGGKQTFNPRDPI